LPIAVSGFRDRSARCDALGLVSDVLPQFLDGHKDFSSPADTVPLCKYGTNTWALLEAKFWYFNYEQSRRSCARK